MMIIGHTAIGVAIGLLVPNPLAAFALGVVSHHLADWTPHFDAGSYYSPENRQAEPTRRFGKREWFYVTADVILTALLLALFTPHLPAERIASVDWAILGALLPDLVHNVPFWNRGLRKIRWNRWWHDEIHRKYQSTVPLNLWYVGVATQLVVIAAASWLVFK